jgi:glycosyltransferase involved in cell wall biosynthesis
MKLSVIIPTFGRPSALRDVLGDVVAQEHLAAEVLVVSQGAEEERLRTAAVISGLAGVRQLHVAERSAAAARNAALSDACGDWVVFSDDDTRWPSDLLLRLVRKVRADPALALVAACDSALPREAKPFWRRILGAFFFSDRLVCPKAGHVLPSMQGRYPHPVVGDVPTDWAMGYWFAADLALMRRRGLRFDEKLTRYSYGEDLLLTSRICAAALSEGRHTVLSGDLAVEHLATREWREPDGFAVLCGPWNRLYIAGQLRRGWALRAAVAAVFWSSLHQALTRVARARSPWPVLRAHLIAAFNLPAILRGEFAELHRRHG